MLEECLTTVSNWTASRFTELSSTKEKQSMDLPVCCTGMVILLKPEGSLTGVTEATAREKKLLQCSSLLCMLWKGLDDARG